MTFENLLTTMDNGILTITINRPDKLNALNTKTIEEIGVAIIKAKSTDSVKAIIRCRSRHFRICRTFG